MTDKEREQLNSLIDQQSRDYDFVAALKKATERLNSPFAFPLLENPLGGLIVAKE